ncbi:MAG: hypothetical protein KGK01_09290 [Bradyrhizobium sp.]|nr:hypothetical protein [Pseudomonadota bacterium]MDE2242617.1 hypothetical protein [Bradyrhizobium sp.]MDE2470727.1 hypothetical protein [Bradyrhizobium sp.]
MKDFRKAGSKFLGGKLSARIGWRSVHARSPRLNVMILKTLASLQADYERFATTTPITTLGG